MAKYTYKEPKTTKIPQAPKLAAKKGAKAKPTVPTAEYNFKKWLSEADKKK
jgi:hypothetical protein